MPNRKWWVLASVACGTFMSTLDSSIVNVALPTLSKDLYVGLSGIKWVVILYLLMITTALLPMGRISDRYGRRKSFMTGFVLFTLGPFLCALSSSLTTLILSRTLQGLGAAMLMANGPAVITATFPSSERGKGIGILGMIVSAGLVSGPAIGGFLIHQWGWQSIFLVNLPIGVLGIFLGSRFLPPDSKLPVGEGWSFDWLGTFIQCIVLSGAIFLVDIPRDEGGNPYLSEGIRALLGLVLVGMSFFFLYVEKRAKSPIFDLSLFQSRVFLTSSLSGFLMFVAYSSIGVMIPFFLEAILLVTPSRSGLLMSFLPITIFFIAPWSGKLSDRWGSRGLSGVGAFLLFLGLIGLGGIYRWGGVASGMNPQIVGLWLVMVGLGLGIFQSPNNSAIMGSAPFEKLGVASAISATTRNLGMVLGTGFSTEIFTYLQRGNMDFVGALRATFLVSGSVAFLSMCVALSRKADVRP